MLGGLGLACLNAGASDPAAGTKGRNAVTPQILKAAPTTVEVPIPEEVRRHVQDRLAQGSLDIVRLVVRGVRPQGARALKGVRIFIDRPDADRKTPVDDPHYAGSFVLGLQDSQDFLWNVAPTLSRLWGPNGMPAKPTIQVTFVPEAWEDAAELPADFALPFASIELEIPAGN